MATSREQVGARGATVALRGLGKRYGQTVAVHAVDVTIDAGEILALLGPSGCGKTTTLRMIAGLVRPSSGAIEIDGKDVATLPAHRRNLGMLFQNYALFPHLSARANVAFGLEMRRLPKEEIAAGAMAALRLVRLEALAERLPSQLSGGQQQRVALARALAYEPRALLLDEPFGALDKKLREVMQVEIRELCTRLGLTTILVTHDQEEALTLADRIAVMRDGRIEQIGTAREIYDRPRTRFVADFIGTSNFFAGTVEDIEAGAAIVRTAEGQRLRAVPAADALPGVGRAVVVAIRPESLELRPGEPTGDGLDLIRGTVAQAIFKGQSLSTYLECGGERPVIAQSQLGRGESTLPRPGEIWHARVPPGRAILVEDE